MRAVTVLATDSDFDSRRGQIAMNLCKDCRHYRYDAADLCVHEKIAPPAGVNYVTGGNLPQIRVHAQEARNNADKCGQSAQYFEVRAGIKTEPSSATLQR